MYRVPLKEELPVEMHLIGRGNGALFDRERVYRFALWRSWDGRKKRAVFILLNPSTADESTDDPTVAWCKEFANTEGFGSMVITNLYAYRASRPADLAKATYPIGPGNTGVIQYACAYSDRTFVGWGNSVTEVPNGTARAIGTVTILAPVYALGRTVAGHPMHPMAFARNGWTPKVEVFGYAAPTG